MLRSAVADPSKPGSLAHSARARRWSELLRRFPALGAMRVLDLGGTSGSWLHAPMRPAEVVCVNTDPGGGRFPCPGVTVVTGDACAPPASVRAQRFDLVYSNSLLEHLGGHARRERFAEVVNSLGAHHWVQTPYRYFPIEPHWLFPGLQWLPFRARVAVSRHWPYGHIRSAGHEQAVRDVAEVELLSYCQMRSYFPASGIWTERFAGVPKSLVAVA